MNFGPDTQSRKGLALLGVLMFAVVPGWAQGHFIRKFHVDGHVYIYAEHLGYTEQESRGGNLPCLDRQKMCPHECAGRYSLVPPKPPAEGGYWNNMYRYGEPRNDPTKPERPKVRESVTFYPILQPIVVIVLTLVVLAMQISAVIRPRGIGTPATRQ